MYLVSIQVLAILLPFIEGYTYGSGVDIYGMQNRTGRSKRQASTCNDLTGCPTSIPVLEGASIVAGRIYYHGPANTIPELSCGGPYFDYHPGSCSSTTTNYGFHSLIVNPGCKLIVFENRDFTGNTKEYGSGLLSYVPPGDGGVVHDCSGCITQDGNCNCIRAMLWSCTQTYPSCSPSDSWQTIVELDNSDSKVKTTFTYTKEVGTTFSEEMKESKSVSATISATISASFWGIQASLGVSATTGYDWTKTDQETKSESKSYTVQIQVPPGLKVAIEEAVGTCGGSVIKTQMYRILDIHNGYAVLHKIHGTTKKFKL